MDVLKINDDDDLQINHFFNIQKFKYLVQSVIKIINRSIQPHFLLEEPFKQVPWIDPDTRYRNFNVVIPSWE